MPTGVTFRPYAEPDRDACLAIFDANCPEYFAPNERADYAGFLEPNLARYEVCVAAGRVVGAFGLMGVETDHRQLNWILIDPAVQGLGIGSAIMARVLELAREDGVAEVRIAASHRSAPFFARFGAVETAVIPHGWGPNMHRHDMSLGVPGSAPVP